MHHLLWFCSRCGNLQPRLQAEKNERRVRIVHNGKSKAHLGRDALGDGLRAEVPQHANPLPAVEIVNRLVIHLELLLQQPSGFFVVQLAQIGAGARDGGGLGLAEQAVHGVLAHAFHVLEVRECDTGAARVAKPCK